MVNKSVAQTADNYFDKGLELIYEQKYNDAIMNFDKCINLEKNNEIAYYNRGLCKYYLKEYKGAIKDYEKAIKIKKDYPNAYDNMGLAYEAEGNLDDAIKCYTTSISIDNYNYSGYYFRGIARYSKRDYSAAMEDFNKALEIKPKSNDPLIYKGLIKYNMLQYDEAISIFTNALTLNAADGLAFYNRALCYLAKGNKTLACEDFGNAVANGYEKASVQNKHYCGAILLAIELQKNKNEYDTKMLQAENKFNQGSYNDAKDLFTEAKSILPLEQKPDRMISLCDEKIEAITKANNEKEYKILITQADRAYDNKQYDIAKSFYEQAVTISGDDTYPQNRIASIEKKSRIEKTPIVVEGTKNLATLFKQQKEAVFLVYTSDNESTSQGSGFFITADGIAVSNYHVFKGTFMNTTRIYTDDGSNYKVSKVLEKNEDKDYIIFKVEKENNNQKFQAVKIAKALPEIGESVFAIGNPEGLSQTISNGIVSGYRAGKQYIQTTTPITHGSSGGPLFNMKGEVIGITSKGMQEGSLFFAISIKELNLNKYIQNKIY